MSTPRFSVLRWENLNAANIEAYAQRVEVFYQLAIREAALIAESTPIDPTRPFRFQDYPMTANRVNQFLSELASGIRATIEEGQAAGWNLANQKNDALVDAILETSAVPRSRAERFLNRNLEALKAFQSRKTAGLDLSRRVFTYTGQFKRELELGIDVGLGEGKSADQLSRDLRGYLNRPDKLFRRVRDKRGNLALSRAAEVYQPGRGVYRSSYKNAMRLARTEINMAYRASDYERYQQLDFVVGIQVNLSPRHVIRDICDDLKGRYPKTFKFLGWHPLCRCYTTTILASPAELSAMNRRLLNDEDTAGMASVKDVTELPEGFTTWLSANRARWEQPGGTNPLFLVQNPQVFQPRPAPRPVPVPIPVPVPPPAPIDQAARFRAAGWNVSGGDAVFNNLYAQVADGFDFDQFNQTMNALVAADNITFRSRILSAGYGTISMELTGANAKGEIFDLSRNFMLHKGQRTVKHEYFKIPKDLQGKGISKKVFQALYEQYQNAKVERIEVFANIDIGGYTWARYGFSFKNEVDRRMIVNRAQRAFSGKTLDAFNAFWATVKDVPVFPLQAFTQTPWGKKVLLGSNWDGYIDLTDANQRTLFENYLFGR